MAKNVKINGVTYSNVPQVDIPLSDGSGNAVFYDPSSDTAVAGSILSGMTAHSAGGAITGTMPNKGKITGTISTAAGSYTIPAGYHDGTGDVSIDSDEQAKIIAGNIKSGITILGVEGSSMVLDTTLSTTAASAANITSGKQAYVNGAVVTGTLTSAIISQDDSTKVLTIS